MRQMLKHVYEFGPFVMDPAERLLLREGQPVRLRAKAFDTLAVLVEHAGRIVTKDDLLRSVWHGQFVEENNLSQSISLVRRALGRRAGSTYVETVPGRGYRFAMPVVDQWNTPTEPSSPSKPAASGLKPDTPAALPIPQIERPGGAEATTVPETRYARSGDDSIAYQVVGDGPIDLMLSIGWVSHLEQG